MDIKGTKKEISNKVPSNLYKEANVLYEKLILKRCTKFNTADTRRIVEIWTESVKSFENKYDADRDNEDNFNVFQIVTTIASYVCVHDHKIRIDLCRKVKDLTKVMHLLYENRGLPNSWEHQLLESAALLVEKITSDNCNIFDFDDIASLSPSMRDDKIKRQVRIAVALTFLRCPASIDMKNVYCIDKINDFLRSLDSLPEKRIFPFTKKDISNGVQKAEVIIKRVKRPSTAQCPETSKIESNDLVKRPSTAQYSRIQS